MLDTIKNAVGLGEYKKTFDSIIEPIKKVIADLETHQEQNASQSYDKLAQAKNLTEQASVHQTEAERAKAVRAKFEALIS